MPASFYSPNNGVTGAAVGIEFNIKDQNVWFTFIKQTANNPDKKGNFKGGEMIRVKFNEGEVGGMINAIRTRGQMTFFHDFNDKVSGGLSCYSKDVKGQKVYGFGLKVKRGETVWTVGLSAGQAEWLMEFLKTGLNKFALSIYANDKKNFEIRQAKKQTEEASEPEPERSASAEPGENGEAPDESDPTDPASW